MKTYYIFILIILVTACSDNNIVENANPGIGATAIVEIRNLVILSKEEKGAVGKHTINVSDSTRLIKVVNGLYFYNYYIKYRGSYVNSSWELTRNTDFIFHINNETKQIDFYYINNFGSSNYALFNSEYYDINSKRFEIKITKINYEKIDQIINLYFPIHNMNIENLAYFEKDSSNTETGRTIYNYKYDSIFSTDKAYVHLRIF